MDHLCPHIKQWKVRTLLLGKSASIQVESSTTTLSSPFWVPCPPYLDLSENNIESVEMLHRMRMSSVAEINISNNLRSTNRNCMSNTSQLKKVSSPNHNGVSISRSSSTQMAA